jgi:toxin HigB-1
VVKTFRHAGLKRYFTTGNSKGIPPEMLDRIRRRLNVLDRARELRDVNLPGFDFHPLKGDRKGEFAIAVTGNYRMTFRFEGADVFDVDLEDYH